MQWINELLGYSKRHSQAVIVILLGVIAIGTLGGGLQIRMLERLYQEKTAALAERDALERQRLEALQTTWNSQRDDAARHLDELTRRIQDLQEYTAALDKTVSDHLEADKKRASAVLSADKQKRPQIALSAAMALFREADDFRAAVDHNKRTLAFSTLSALRTADVARASLRMEVIKQRQPERLSGLERISLFVARNIVTCGLTALLLATLLTSVLIRRNRKRSAARVAG